LYSFLYTLKKHAVAYVNQSPLSLLRIQRSLLHHGECCIWNGCA
uniref:Uncharacterized protein n=1 Tax=Solanum lycopersicum TaxID=4081 RepID=A0A3Q7GUF5_SOLLC